MIVGNILYGIVLCLSLLFWSYMVVILYTAKNIKKIDRDLLSIAVIWFGPVLIGIAVLFVGKFLGFWGQ